MTAETIKEFLVSLGFDVDQAGLKKFSAGLAGATAAAGLAASAAAAAGGAIVAMVAHVADGLDQVGDLGDRTNNTATDLMRLRYVATLTRSSVGALDSSVENLSRTMGEAAIGIGRGAATFKALSLSPKKANGELKTTAEMLAEVGEKIRGLPRATQLATLGKLGIDPTLVQSLTTDVSGLGAEFEKVYGGLGVNLDDAAAEAGAFNDSMDRLKFVAGAAYQAVGIKLMPQVRRGIDTVRQRLVAALPRIVDAITPMLDAILRVGEALVSLGDRILQFGAVAVDWFGRVNEATDGWAGYILAALAAWKLLNLGFLASPLGIILGLSAAVLLLVDDFLTWREGGESLIDWGSDFGVMLQTVAGFVLALVATIGVVKGAMVAWAAANAAWAVVQGVVNVAMGLFYLGLLPVLATIGAVVVAIGLLGAAGYQLVKHWDDVKAWFSDFFGGLLDGFGDVADAAGKVAGFFGFGGDSPAPAGAAMLTPSPAAQASLGGTTQNVSQKTEINVNGAGDPAAVGRAVVGVQDRVNADQARNLRGHR